MDDEPDIHLTIRNIIETSSEFVLAGSYLNGVEAIQGITAHPPDLVLMDIRLPDISGIECTRRLARVLPSLRIVMISALGDRDTVAQALEAGCHGYVNKPFVPRQFLPILLCAMAQRSTGSLTQSTPAFPCPLRANAGAKHCLAFGEREAKVLLGLSKGRFYKDWTQSGLRRIGGSAWRCGGG